MPMVVFVTLAANELILSKAHKFSNMKIATSAVKVSRHIDQTPPEKNEMKICMDVWKAIIPTISILFILTFFIVCLHIVLECPLSDPKSTIAETGMGVTSRP